MLQMMLNVNLNHIVEGKLRYNLKRDKGIHDHELFIKQGDRELCTVLHLENSETTKFFNGLLRDIISTITNSAKMEVKLMCGKTIYPRTIYTT